MNYIDLHLHLDGAITVDIAKKLAKLQGIELPAKTDEELSKLLMVPEDCKDLVEFLQCFALPCSLMQTKEGLSEAARLVCESLKAQGVIYAEIRYAPLLHLEKGLNQSEVVEAVLDGIKKSGLKANLILCCMRMDAKEANLETVEVAKKYLVKDGGVVALDLAGSELDFRTGKYDYVFEKANEYGIPFTIHAGEACGAENVWLALKYGAKRIGHGVRSSEDPELMKKLAAEGIFLEMCPTSNKDTQIFKDLKDYPVIDFLNAGIKATLNTDDPAIEGTTIAREFELMEKLVGLSKDQEKQLLNNSIDAAFTTAEVKAELRKQLGL